MTNLTDLNLSIKNDRRRSSSKSMKKNKSKNCRFFLIFVLAGMMLQLSPMLLKEEYDPSSSIYQIDYDAMDPPTIMNKATIASGSAYATTLTTLSNAAVASVSDLSKYITTTDNKNANNDEEEEEEEDEPQSMSSSLSSSLASFSNDGVYNKRLAEKEDQLIDVLPSKYRESKNLPKWMKEYFDWHRNQISIIDETNWNTTDVFNETTGQMQPDPNGLKFLILRCPQSEQCGGLSDRIKPLLVLTAIAAHTKRLLMVWWERPYPIEEFLIPNEINWTVPSYMLDEISRYGSNRKRFKGIKTVSRTQLTGPKLSKLRSAHQTIVGTRIQSEDGGSLFYVCVLKTMLAKEKNDKRKMSKDDMVDQKFSYRHCFENHQFLFTNPNATRLGKKLYARQYHDFFHAIIRPNPNVRSLIDQRMNDAGLIPGKFIGAHYRSDYGDGEKDRVGKSAIEWASRVQVRCAALMRPGYPVYFAADSGTAIAGVREESESLLKRKNITIVTPPSAPSSSQQQQHPLHIEFDKGTVEEFYPAFVDLLVMGNSMCQLHGVGGFGA